MENPESKNEIILKKITEIEAEMKKSEMWQSEGLTEDQLNFQQAFGMDKLSYEQWLQFVFIPIVHRKLETGEAFPTSSMLGTKAIREYDGQEKASKLVSLLCEFDGLFNLE